MTVEVVHILEEIEIEQEQDVASGLGGGVGKPFHQLPSVGEAGHWIDERGFPCQLVRFLERALQIFRTPPPEQDDGDVEDQGGIQAAIARADPERRGDCMVSQPKEGEKSRKRRAAGEQAAACQL